MLAGVDVNAYRAEAEEFLSTIDREYYLHFAGLKDDYEIEAIYARHASLFSREAVETLREGDSRVLLKFAAEGYVEQAVKELAAEFARLEAALEVELDGKTYPFRQAAVVQANESDAERRRAMEKARNEIVATRLNPLLREMFDRSGELVRELGWPSVRAMTEELSGIDLGALAQQTEAFLTATEASYEDTVEPPLRAQLGLGFDELERADLAFFFRAPSLDALFPSDQLLPTFEATLEGLGLENGRPAKSCSTPSRGRRSRRARSALPSACLTRSISSSHASAAARTTRR